MYVILNLSYPQRTVTELYFFLSPVNYPACASSPCRHNGTCIDGTTHPDMNFDENGYHCLCHVGYEGKNCESKYFSMLLRW